MPTPTHRLMPIALILLLTAIGCDNDDNENQRLADMAERQLERQAEQNRRTTELQREVAEGSRQLVEADARAREEMVTLHRDVQAERSEIGRQRDRMEEERRELAAQRQLNPIIAAAITNTGLLLACLLPLVLCWYLLHRPVEEADNQAMTELLLEDLVAEKPLLQQRGSIHAIGNDQSDARRLTDETAPTDPTAG